MSTSCPDEDQLLQLASDSLEPPARESIESHLADCRMCRHLVVLMQAGSTADDDVATPGSSPGSASMHARTVAEAARVGRFVLLRRLDAGAMGAVYAAYDEQLDRRVAVKLMLRESTPAARARVEREAQAMARLTHPNVVHVYEVGQDGGELFIAMEFVEGSTLAQWQIDRSWEQVLAAYRQAGAGLAAAHAAGVVHRDFKPHNVMVEQSDSGAPRVKVLDFGLALRAQADASEITDDGTRVPGPSDETQSRLTVEGGILGTPAYMPPEQVLSSDVTTAADQYSFCVSLWEGLYGDRPVFDPDDPSGQPPRPSQTEVPMWLHRAVVRGLAPSPDERWPSMDDLLRALEPAKPGAVSRSPLRRVAALGLFGAMAAGAAAMWTSTQRPCTGAAQRLQDAWGDARRAEIEAAITDTAVPFAASTWTRTETALDDYVDRWRAMHTAACEATTVRGEQSESVMDLRMACLHRAEVELSSISDVLARADADVVEHADAVLDGLHPLARCEDISALQAEIEPPRDDEADAVEAIQALLSKAGAERRAGRFTAAEQALAEVDRRITDVEYEPVHTDRDLVSAQLLDDQGDYPAAEHAFDRALGSATRSRRWRAMLTAANGLLSVIGSEQRQAERALQYASLAEGLAHGVPRLEAEVADRIGVILWGQGKYEEAEAKLRRALELVAEELSPDDPTVARMHNHLGAVLYDRGAYEDAEAASRTALEIYERRLGPEHPTTASARSNLARSLSILGRHREAEHEYRLARQTVSNALGADHPNVARYSVSLATVLDDLGRYDEAESELRAAHALLLEHFGPEHPDVSAPLTNLATIMVAQGRIADAEVELRAALEQLERALEPGHPDIAQARSNVATILAAQGKSAEAEPLLRDALAAWAKALGPDHPDLRRAHHNLGNLLGDLGRHDEALVEHRRSLELAENALGPRSRAAGQAHIAIGVDFVESGDFAAAEQQLRLGRDIYEEVLGPEHDALLEARSNLATTLYEQGKTDEAIAELRVTVETLERTMPDHSVLVPWRTNLARMLMDDEPTDERTAEALTHIEKAWERCAGEDVLAPDRASATFVLAEILWFAGRPEQRERALELARDAVAAYDEAGDGEASAHVRSWVKAKAR